MNSRVIYENKRKKKSKWFKLTKNLFQGPEVALYSLDTPLVNTLNVSYCWLSLAERKDRIYKTTKYLRMKDILSSSDMQMLRSGDNVANTWSLRGKITMILTAFYVLNL